jgi:hypothetical protein
MDTNTGVMSYDDPRDEFEPVASAYLMAKVSAHQSVVRRMTKANVGFDPSAHTVDTVPSTEKAASAPPVPSQVQWKIGKCDVLGYDELDYMLVERSEIPAEARNKKHNRYMDILPTARTRIRLPFEDHLGRCSLADVMASPPHNINSHCL